jgi:NAD(P)-dependent dehydrogenase (short-subunit alcohol dehydrogenase family)
MNEHVDLSMLPDIIHGVVYCPGNILLKPFARFGNEDFIKDYQLQVLGAVKVIQAVLPKLKASGNASIVLFSTVAVQTGFSFHSVVAASKGALEGLTRALAAEFAPHIRVNCIAPGIIEVDRYFKQFPNYATTVRPARIAKVPMGFLGDPADIANTAIFLASDAARYITGQIIRVDGGLVTNVFYKSDDVNGGWW